MTVTPVTLMMTPSRSDIMLTVKVTVTARVPVTVTRTESEPDPASDSESWQTPAPAHGAAGRPLNGVQPVRPGLLRAQPMILV